MHIPKEQTIKRANAQLFEALYFLKMIELKNVCLRLKLSPKGAKGELIESIKHFVATGNMLQSTPIPAISKAQKNQTYPLAADMLMLMGSYKNDAKTRAFFKKLIGEHFHFTAFGIDWLNICWKQGKPPTYQEFADMWQREYERRQKIKPEPKKEWAYITLVQQYGQKNPKAKKRHITDSWNKIRSEKVALVHELLKIPLILLFQSLMP